MTTPISDPGSLDPHITESGLRSHLVAHAKTFGWAHFHQWRSDHSAAGYPDDTFVHPIWKRCLVMELKREIELLQDQGSKLTWEQRWYLVALRRCGHETMVCRPSDWVEAIFLLGTPQPFAHFTLPILRRWHDGEWDGTLTEDELAMGPEAYAALRTLQTGTGRRVTNKRARR